MEAGRKLDALIAEHVMGEPRPTGNVPDGVLAGVMTSNSGGGNWIGTTTGYTAGDEPVWLPKPYSTDISAAWEVVEKMRADKLSITLTGYWEGSTGKWWVNVLDNVETVATVRTDTAPHAICLAALEAVGCSLEEEKS